MTRTPTRKTRNSGFEKQVAISSVDFLMCRDLGHAWNPTTVTVRSRHYEQGLMCSRCGTERDRITDMRGYLTGGRYRYPSDYTFSDVGFLTKDQRAFIRKSWESAWR